MAIKIKDYNSIPWKEIVYYDESSPTFLRYVKGNRTINPKNQRNANDIAGNRNKKYSSIKYGKDSWVIHRIVWILHNDTIPEAVVINHIDFDTHNNCISNLEVCTFRQNLCRTQVANKRSFNVRNKSGVNGVYECIKYNGYREYKYANVTWKDPEGKVKNKLFSYDKYTKEVAWKLAVEFRQDIELQLKLEGFG